MKLLNTVCMLTVAAGLSFAGQQAAMAADDCLAQTKALAPAADKVTDAKVKEKIEKLLKTAVTEATEEYDEDECLDALKDAKKLLGME